MAFMIAFAYDEDCEKELLKKGFKKVEVYLKTAPSGGTSKDEKHAGESEFFRMSHKPFQFAVTSYWGATFD